MALTFDQITAITRKYWMPKYPQLVFDQNLVQKRLAAKGTKPTSGESIMQPVMHASDLGGFYSDYDTFDVSGQEQVTSARYYWKYAEVPITIARSELLKNQGPEGVKKLLDSKMKLAAMKMSDILAVATFSITPGTDSDEDLIGLDQICEDASGSLNTNGGGTCTTTLGGIDKASYSWWAGWYHSGGGNAKGPDYVPLTNFFYEICDGSIQPNLIVMHNNSFATYMGSQQAYQRYMKQSELDSGFLTAEFNGKTMVADLHVSDAGTTTEAENRIYMLNLDFLDFVTHRDENNRLEPFAKPVDQAVGVAHIMWAGELTCSDPSRQGVICNFDSLSQTAMS